MAAPAKPRRVKWSGVTQTGRRARIAEIWRRSHASVQAPCMRSGTTDTPLFPTFIVPPSPEADCASVADCRGRMALRIDGRDRLANVPDAHGVFAHPAQPPKD